MSRNMCSFAAPNPSFNQKSTKDPNFETFYLQIAISTNFTVFVVVSESPRRKSFVLKDSAFTQIGCSFSKFLRIRVSARTLFKSSCVDLFELGEFHGN